MTKALSKHNYLFFLLNLSGKIEYSIAYFNRKDYQKGILFFQIIKSSGSFKIRYSYKAELIKGQI